MTANIAVNDLILFVNIFNSLFQCFLKNTMKNDVHNQYMILYIICQAWQRLYYDVESNQMTSLREILAHNLKKKRRSCGFSQARLAEMVNVSTHHIATISDDSQKH